MTPETIIIFAISIVLLYIKPGPNQAMKITKALNDGFLPAYFFTIGATCTVVFYFLISTFGATARNKFINIAGLNFKIKGGRYILYMGIRGLKNLQKGLWKGRVEKAHKSKLFENFSLGLVMTLANPITIFYFVGIVPSFIQFGELRAVDIMTGLCVIVFMGNLSDIILIALVSQVKTALSSEKFVRGINMFSSCGFIAIGAFFLFSAFMMNDFSFEM